MNVVIRTDASIEIGSGHVMRCMTLAKQLQRHKLHVTFICREVEGNFITILEKKGFPVIAIPSIDAHLTKDAEATIHIIEDFSSVDLLIVDHYDIDIRWEAALRPYVKKIMVIDDLANRRHHCDLLLDQNLYENMEARYEGLIPNDCKTLLGPAYVLLRDEFLQMELRESTGKIKMQFVFFGGADPTGETVKTLQALQQLNRENITVHVVVGAANPHKEKIEQICMEMANVHYHYQIDYMAKLMQEADLAIGAGGAITWERCLLGLPTLTVTIAKNQEEATKLLHDMGAIMYLGKHDVVTAQMIAEQLRKLIDDSERVKQLAKRSTAIVPFEKVKEYPVVREILKLIGVD